MPTIGPFHRFYWKARANTPPPAGTWAPWGYPRWQTAPRSGVMLSLAIWGVSLDTIRPVLTQIRWVWRLVRVVWWIRDAERQAVLWRVIEQLASERWPHAQSAVRACAHTPKFHHADQWVEYGRALKANPGQAQNVFRHVKVVHALRGLQDDGGPISNPDAHLLAELAYQGYAAMGRPGRKVVAH